MGLYNLLFALTLASCCFQMSGTKTCPSPKLVIGALLA